MNKPLTKVSLFLLTALFLTSCGSLFQSGPAPTPTLDRYNPEFTITMDEFTFTPDRIRLIVGQTVTIHLVNNGEEEHEIMIGRNPIRDANGELGDGFEHDFFALTEVSVEGDAQVMGMNGDSMDMSSEDSMDTGSDDSMDMGSDSSMDTGSNDSMDMGEGEMGNGGMVMLDAKGEATITFTVNEGMEGAWTIGCFEGNTPRHFDLGMAGILYVRNFDK